MKWANFFFQPTEMLVFVEVVLVRIAFRDRETGIGCLSRLAY